MESEMRIELVQVPVSDIDRAKAFYVEKVGFNADHDHQVTETLRFVQSGKVQTALVYLLVSAVTWIASVWIGHAWAARLNRL